MQITNTDILNFFISNYGQHKTTIEAAKYKASGYLNTYSKFLAANPDYTDFTNWCGISFTSDYLHIIGVDSILELDSKGNYDIFNKTDFKLK